MICHRWPALMGLYPPWQPDSVPSRCYCYCFVTWQINSSSDAPMTRWWCCFGRLVSQDKATASEKAKNQFICRFNVPKLVVTFLSPKACHQYRSNLQITFYFLYPIHTARQTRQNSPVCVVSCATVWIEQLPQRVQTSHLLSATVLSGRESDSHRRSGHDTDKTVLSRLARRSELAFRNPPKTTHICCECVNTEGPPGDVGQPGVPGQPGPPGRSDHSEPDDDDDDDDDDCEGPRGKYY